MCDSVQIRSNRSIKIFPKSKQIGFIVSYHTFQEIEEFKKCNPMTPEEAREQGIQNLKELGMPVTLQERVEWHLNLWKRSLEKGGLRTVTTYSEGTILLGSEVIGKVVDCLKNPSSSLNDKYKCIGNLVNFENAKWILYNYRESEWPALHKEEK
jgi:hypothetical protein